MPSKGVWRPPEVPRVSTIAASLDSFPTGKGREQPAKNGEKRFGCGASLTHQFTVQIKGESGNTRISSFDRGRPVSATATNPERRWETKAGGFPM